MNGGTAAWLGWLAIAYAAGSIPFSLLMGFVKGVDIRRHGSGNVGASNCGRVLGRGYGIACFALDVLKGLVPVLGYALWRSRGGEAEAAILSDLAWLTVGAAAVLGHVFPVWLRFQGGKGVATGLGVMLGFWPVLTLPGLIAAVLWVIVIRTTGYVSAASIASACALPLLALINATTALKLGGAQTLLFVGVTVVLAALVVWRHRSNLIRLRAGTEPRAAWTERRAR